MANLLGIFVVIILIIIIGLYNIKNYGKIVNDIFEPTSWFAIFLVVFFGLNFCGTYIYSMETIILLFLAGVSYLVGYYSKTRIKKSGRIKIFRKNYVGSIRANTYLIRTMLLVVLNIGVKYLQLKSYGISFEAFISNMMRFAALSKEGGYVWLGITYPLQFLNYMNMIGYVRKEQRMPLVFVCQFLFSLSTFNTSRFYYINNIILIPLLIRQLYILRKPSFKMYYWIILGSVPSIMIILNFIRHGQFQYIDFDFASLIQNAADSLSGDTNPGRNLDFLVRYLRNTNGYNYGKYFIYQIASIIPRAIWKDKPITSFCFQYTLDIFGIDPILDGTTKTFTIFDTVSAGGTIFCAISQYLFGRFSRWIYVTVYSGKNVFVSIFCLSILTNYINVLRGSWMDMLAIYFLYYILSITVYYIYCIFNNNMSNNEAEVTLLQKTRKVKIKI